MLIDDQTVRGMRRWFLSYNSQDLMLMQGIEATLRRMDPQAHIFFASKTLRAGGYWLPELAKEIAASTAFVLVVGENGLGPWQNIEYYEALDRRVKEPDYPVLLVLQEGQPAPGLPFLRQLHWIVAADPASNDTINKLLDATGGEVARQRELWRNTAPYRGLAAMTEADSDFFFGRERETVDVVNALANSPDKIPVLLGNSGVGKSSLAQAGVLASLLRQGFPEHASNAGPWPPAFNDSRHWCFLTLRPGIEPVRALVEPFIRTWKFDATDPQREMRQNQWIESLMSGAARLRGLLDATQDRLRELGQAKAPTFLLYIDQGEELYVRAEESQRRRFSEIIAREMSDPRLRVLMSLRADFLGALQGDEELYAVHRQINVPPLREAELREIVNRPAALLSARFESSNLANDIAQRAARESASDAGALPLLSYLLDDMWTKMVERGDGVLRLPIPAIELGAVLVERADAFLAQNPESEDALRRIFTLKLATVRPDGEPMRRRAPRSDFDKDEWELVSKLADHPHRLLVTTTLEGGAVYAEVAHETIFRRWDKLQSWIDQERGFLAWRSELEAARHRYQGAAKSSRRQALLMGLPLAQALDWRKKRSTDLSHADCDFIDRSVRHRRSQRMRAVAGVAAFAAAGVLASAAWWNWSYLHTAWDMRSDHHFWRTALAPESETSLKASDEFQECRRCPRMVIIPAGTFSMGTAGGEKGKFYDEFPQHGVTIKSAFAVSKFPLTFEQYDACVAIGECPAVGDQGWGRGRRPIINVSWNDAKLYVAWLSKNTGKSYRLLTEAEWEYAARAGSTTAYVWGPDTGQGKANCKDCGGDWLRSTTEVGAYQANKFGLHDMGGNVWQWVEDCAHMDYRGAPSDGSAWMTDCEKNDQGKTNHIMRGGSWLQEAYYVRPAARFAHTFDNRYVDIGFRVARTIQP